ncbi:MAG: MgtC/SapB family protein [Methanocellales archaeon]|nr:MgtC/SapB family protein [Methanocellales archaeon]MDD3291817.1 MgtC/SapB family protein [Methanocellales archaeon]MDD5234569.1 MgtC/SapB family protein [Methanocellales archaeon]MDD5485078.1 MgtC/SapB family protein [Methanocellales archaeon]
MINDVAYEYALKIGLGLALGMFIGLEREWAHKEPGIRTFALVSLCGTIFSFVSPQLVLIGACFVIIASVLLSIQSLLQEEDIHLTTITSLMLTYGAGVLVGMNRYSSAIIVAIIITAILTLKQELHNFVGGISSQELRGAIKFGILAFVVFPILPNEYIDPWQVINPRMIWLMVVLVSGMGFANYAMMKKMGARGIAYTGFFGGLANSTAIVSELSSRTKERPDLMLFAASAVVLSNVAMCARNLLVCTMFSVELAVTIALPLLSMMFIGILYALITRRDTYNIDVDVRSPFSMKNALIFGLIFLGMIALATTAHMQFGEIGFYISEFISGTVSSTSATISAVVLYQAGKVSKLTAALGIILSNISGIVIKVGLVTMSGNMKFTKNVTISSILIVTVSLATTLLLFVL